MTDPETVFARLPKWSHNDGGGDNHRRGCKWVRTRPEKRPQTGAQRLRKSRVRRHGEMEPVLPPRRHNARTL
jgi:hypothetical protein